MGSKQSSEVKAKSDTATAPVRPESENKPDTAFVAQSEEKRDSGQIPAQVGISAQTDANVATVKSRAGPGSLDECTDENTPKWSFKGISSAGRVVRVYDGDTVTIAFDTFGLGFYQHQVRLLGIDSPEIRGKSPEEKKAAIAAREYMKSLVLGKTVLFRVSSSDKYGRLLANIWVGDRDVSALMLESGHARPYDGKTRAAWDFSQEDAQTGEN
jgi:endonuclease YncB( thermonuclease family)